MKVYEVLAQTFKAYLNCKDNANHEWKVRHQDRIEGLVKQYMPSGAGFDSGTAFDFDYSMMDGNQRLVFLTSFHHMNDVGMYDGWTAHKITVVADLANRFRVKVSGKNRNDIKDYIHECFHSALDTDIE